MAIQDEKSIVAMGKGGREVRLPGFGAPYRQDGRHAGSLRAACCNLWGVEVALNRILAALVGGAVIVAGGVAVADSFASAKQTDFFSPGKHQFYVWCAAGNDYTAIQKGKSAEDAQMKLYEAVKAVGRSACWPVWQGCVSG